MEEGLLKVGLVAKTIPVNNLEKMSLEDLQAYAYSKSYQSESSIEVVEKFGLGKGHTSPLEFLDFTFDIQNISRPCLAQLTRQRIGWSYNVESQRYNNYTKDYKYVIPPSIKKLSLEGVYKEMIYSERNYYKTLLEEGVSKEDARFILPPATSVNLLAKANLRALLHFWKLRSDFSNQGQAAQWEIRGLANTILDLTINEIPKLEVSIRSFLKTGDIG